MDGGDVMKEAGGGGGRLDLGSRRVPGGAIAAGGKIMLGVI